MTDSDSCDRGSVRADDARSPPLAAQTQPRQQEEFTSDRSASTARAIASRAAAGRRLRVRPAVFFGYLVSVARRLSAIQTEVNRLDADLKRTGKG